MNHLPRVARASLSWHTASAWWLPKNIFPQERPLPTGQGPLDQQSNYIIESIYSQLNCQLETNFFSLAKPSFASPTSALPPSPKKGVESSSPRVASAAAGLAAGGIHRGPGRQVGDGMRRTNPSTSSSKDESSVGCVRHVRDVMASTWQREKAVWAWNSAAKSVLQGSGYEDSFNLASH